MKKNLKKNPLVKNIQLLKELDKAEYTKYFLKHLAFFKYRKRKRNNLLVNLLLM